MRPALLELTDAIEADFRRWQDFVKTPRLAAHSHDGVIELMPTSDGERYSFKYVNGHPKNAAEGLQTVTAIGLLADVASGYPVLLSEMTLLTALRTGATSALATRWLAPKNARTLALIGNGAQAEFQALALQAACGIKTVRLYDIDARATEKTARNLQGSGLKVVSCRSAEAAVEGAEVITTCTADKRYATILSDNMVGAGVHINAIGGDCPGKTELQREILTARRGVRRIRAADPRRRRDPADAARFSGHRALAGSDRSCAPAAATMAKSPSSTASASRSRIFRRCATSTSASRAADCYDNLDLIADPDDPRDLYGMFLRAA